MSDVLDPIPSYVPKLKLARTHHAATTYHLVPEGRDFGWALCTVNDSTGELLITSDWGNWAHRWSADPAHLGAPTLTHFIAQRDAWGEHACHYLADKLTLGEQHRRRRFDQRKTVAALRRMLCERRLEAARAGRRRLTRELARELWDGIGDIDADDSTLFVERFMRLDGYELITERPWEELEYVPTAEYMVLLHGILPALVEACAAEVKRRTEFEAKYIELPPPPEGPPCR